MTDWYRRGTMRVPSETQATTEHRTTAMTWMPPTNSRGRVPTIRDDSGSILDYDSLTPADFKSGRVYNSCECPCGCQRNARYFPGGTSVRPNLCYSCTDPGADHERQITAEEQAILDRP